MLMVAGVVAVVEGRVVVAEEEAWPNVPPPVHAPPVGKG